MEFRTEIVVKPSLYPLSYSSEVVSVGSCFADVLASDLEASKFNVVANPFGIIYNPISIFKSLSPFQFCEADFVERDGSWYHLHAHSELIDDTAEKLHQKLISKSNQLQLRLSTASHLVITLGTAWIYEYLRTNKVVANCHKLDATLFQKRLLSVTEIISSFKKFYHHLQQINPKLHILFTLSPVRHLKDTLPLNAVSKSTLRLVCHELETTYPNVSYFPAYELLLDDLRDYRFYTDDLLHPTPFAAKYILQKFYGSYINQSTASIRKQVQEIHTAIAHRPFIVESIAHQQFLHQVLHKAKLLSQKVNMQLEIEAIQSQLTDL